MPGNASNASNATGGGGPLGAGGGGPTLPDVVPDGVQSLLDGIFGGINATGRAFGEAVAGLARSITGGGSEAAGVLVPHALDVLGVFL